MGPVCYHLGEFPPETLDWSRLVALVGRANAALARFDGLVSAVPNANVLLSPLTTQEAVLSSRIEGTQVTMGEVLEIEAADDDTHLDSGRRDDAEEVRNYRAALIFAAGAARARGLSLHLLREAHAILMDGVRGRDQSPGAFRVEQNWIGPAGCPIEQASFVPIPQEHLATGLERWATFTSNAHGSDPLILTALMHLEFEALHPFKDGNGRLGRMLIPLQLAQSGALSGPHFFMSGYLEANRDEYVHRMRRVSSHGEWSEWVEFFLAGVLDQAVENRGRAERIVALFQEMQHDIAAKTHSQYASLAAEFIFSRPVFPSSAFSVGSGIPKPTALRMLPVLRDHGILATVRAASGRRPAVYAFRDLINITEGRDVL
ncbi:Fic family protein [Rhodobacteraceae bacterium CCMM004]|nr:Fic family protein [Rhodobacteraceae bacterium CCMM004]